MLAPPALLAIHPLGKSPVIVDGTVTVAESGAVVEYLMDRYGAGRLIPAAGTPERLGYTYWLHYAEGSAMPPLLLKLVFDRVANAPAPWPVSAIARRIAGTVQNSFIGPQLKHHLDYMEAELTAHPWFAGNEFTAADVQMSFPLEAAKSRAGLNASRPRLWDFLERIHAREAYKRALERGGPYSF
jgi:glutathione S-transferase